MGIKTTALFYLSFLAVELFNPFFLVAVTVEQQVFSTEEKDPFARQATKTQTPSEIEGKTPVQPNLSLTPYKDPRLACLLSLILPGSGEIYLRKDLKGVSFCLSTAAAYTVASYYFYTFTLGQRQGLLIGSVAMLVGSIIHIISMVESYNDAIQINEARYYFAE